MTKKTIKKGLGLVSIPQEKNLKRMGRYLCDHLPPMFEIVNLEYLFAPDQSNPLLKEGYVIEISYKFGHFVVGANLGFLVPKNKDLDFLVQAMVNRLRQDTAKVVFGDARVNLSVV